MYYIQVFKLHRDNFFIWKIILYTLNIVFSYSTTKFVIFIQLLFINKYEKHFKKKKYTIIIICIYFIVGNCL